MAAWVLHVDLDQFIAAVELQRRPELVGRPVIVGGRGDPTERGVVSTASYEAREFGVHSGMPLRTAHKRCPDAVFLAVDAAAYDTASAEVMGALRDLEVPVEVLGWDEAYLAVETDDPQEFARRVRQQVLDRTGLHCSVGIGDNRLRAKIATDFGKPRGTYQLTRENWYEVMGHRPTDAITGIGRRTRAKLAALGITTVAELAAADEERLADVLGPTMGPYFRRLGRGGGSASVDPSPYVPRAHGRETTFQTNLDDWSEVEAAARRLADQVALDITREGRPAARVGVKVRFAPFITVQRSLTLPEPTFAADVLAEAAVELLGRFDRTRAVRLVGVRAEMTAP